MRISTLSKLGDRIGKLPNNKSKIQVCLFLIDNALSHHNNHNAREAGLFAFGCLHSFLDFNTTNKMVLTMLKQEVKVNA